MHFASVALEWTPLFQRNSPGPQECVPQLGKERPVVAETPGASGTAQASAVPEATETNVGTPLTHSSKPRISAGASGYQPSPHSSAFPMLSSVTERERFGGRRTSESDRHKSEDNRMLISAPFSGCC